MRFCQDLEVLGEVFADHLDVVFVHFVEATTLFHILVHYLYIRHHKGIHGC